MAGLGMPGMNPNSSQTNMFSGMNMTINVNQSIGYMDINKKNEMPG